MADIVKDPSKLTKELLRKTLIKYDVPLPDAKARKIEYVQLYKKHLIDRPKKFDFSSDEEVVIVSQKSTKQVKRRSVSRSKPMSRELEEKLEEVEDLSDVQLRQQLKRIGGGSIGPVTDTTRRVFQKKLAELLLKTEKVQAVEEEEEEEEDEEEEEEEEEEYSDDDVPEKPAASGDAFLSSRLRPRPAVTSTTQTQTETRRVTRQSLQANATPRQQTRRPRKARRLCPVIPTWAQILLFLLLALFILLVWYNMETMPALPFLGNNTPEIESSPV